MVSICPKGSRTKNRLTPHGSVTGLYSALYPAREQETGYRPQSKGLVPVCPIPFGSQDNLRTSLSRPNKDDNPTVVDAHGHSKNLTVEGLGGIHLVCLNVGDNAVEGHASSPFANRHVSFAASLTESCLSGIRNLSVIGRAAQ